MPLAIHLLTTWNFNIFFYFSRLFNFYVQLSSGFPRIVCVIKVDVLYCIVLYRIVSYCIVLYRIVSYCIVLYRIVSYCIVLYRIVSYCIVLYVPARATVRRSRPPRCSRLRTDSRKLFGPTKFVSFIKPRAYGGLTSFP